MEDQDFSEYPELLASHRAWKLNSGREWTPRDVLLELLKDIDSGKIDPQALVVGYAKKTDDGKGFVVGYRQAAPSFVISLGIMEAVKYYIMNGK